MPGVKVDTGRVGRSGVLDDLLAILQLVVSLVSDLSGELLALDLELLGLGLSLGGSVVDLLADRGSEEGAREEGVGVVSSGSHFEGDGLGGMSGVFGGWSCVELGRQTSKVGTRLV